jgi:hypothetical protein
MAPDALPLRDACARLVLEALRQNTTVTTLHVGVH